MIRIVKPSEKIFCENFPPMKCVIYTRVSTKRQENDGNSLENQLHRCRKYAEYHDMQVKATFQESKSGKTIAARTQFKKAMKSLEKGDVLVVAALSRLARNVREALLIVDELNQKGCHLASTSEEIDTRSAMGKLIFTIFASLAEMESGVTSERVKSGMKRKKEIGGDLGRPPYGWKYVNKKKVRHEDEQSVIKAICAWRDSGMSLHEIIRELDNEGMKPKGGKKWFPATISKILATAEEEEEVDIPNFTNSVESRDPLENQE